MRYFFTCIIFCVAGMAHAQIIITGTVLDKSKINYVEGARVVSTGGMFSITDTLGHYSIAVHENDSLYFTYNNKPTQMFAVNKIANPDQFDVSLRIAVESKYNYLKEVIVYGKTYKQDSIENRKEYADVFEYKKPGLSTSITPGGGVGADADELINMFRFRRNKRLKAFRTRLEEQEQEKYISYKFSKVVVKRLTGLDGPSLDTFLVWYRPSYSFAAGATELQFNQYILNASYQYKNITGAQPGKKEE